MNPLNRLPAPSAFWRVDGFNEADVRLEHAFTTVEALQPGSCLRGMTRWEKRYADGVAFLEWRWQKSVDGRIIPVEPGVVRSNVLLVDGLGKPLLSSRRKTFLASIVYQVPWHAVVIDELRRMELHNIAPKQNDRAVA